MRCRPVSSESPYAPYDSKPGLIPRKNLRGTEMVVQEGRPNNSTGGEQRSAFRMLLDRWYSPESLRRGPRGAGLDVSGDRSEWNHRRLRAIRASVGGIRGADADLRSSRRSARWHRRATPRRGAGRVCERGSQALDGVCGARQHHRAMLLREDAFRRAPTADAGRSGLLPRAGRIPSSHPVRA